jgi:molybdate transport system substrate-binding protein
VGRIGIMVPHGSPLQADGELQDLAAALQDGRLQKFAIANPEHAPYGARAREALQHAGLWEAIQGRLVLGENISQAAQFATSGSTQGGIVALVAGAGAGRGAAGPLRAHPRGLAPAAAPAHGADRKGRRRRPRRLLRRTWPRPAAQAVMQRYGFALPKAD